MIMSSIPALVFELRILMTLRSSSSMCIHFVLCLPLRLTLTILDILSLGISSRRLNISSSWLDVYLVFQRESLSVSFFPMFPVSLLIYSRPSFRTHKSRKALLSSYIFYIVLIWRRIWTLKGFPQCPISITFRCTCFYLRLLMAVFIY